MKLNTLFAFFFLQLLAMTASAQSVTTDDFRLRELTFEEPCGSFHNYQSMYKVECDYPMDAEPAAEAIRHWINQTANYWNKGLYEGDMLQPMQLFQHYMEHFKAENSSEKIERHMVEESGKTSEKIDWNENNEPTWLTTFTYKKEYGSPYIISYSFAWFGYFVGNATSNATKVDATFSRLDGRQLSWEMFTSKDAVCDMVRNALKEKYGSSADLYGNGIPDPKAPLFLGDGVRFDYGNYSVAQAHYFEENGEYPYAFLSYDQLSNLLTPEAKKMLQK